MRVETSDEVYRWLFAIALEVTYTIVENTSLLEMLFNFPPLCSDFCVLRR